MLFYLKRTSTSHSLTYKNKRIFTFIVENNPWFRKTFICTYSRKNIIFYNFAIWRTSAEFEPLRVTFELLNKLYFKYTNVYVWNMLQVIYQLGQDLIEGSLNLKMIPLLEILSENFVINIWNRPTTFDPHNKYL